MVQTYTCEIPPVAAQVVTKYVLPAWPTCHCNKRRGLNLLLACRQIHEEAAPVLWGRNEFCFRSPQQVSGEIGTKLRPEYRQLLQRVAVMPITSDSSPDRTYDMPAAFNGTGDDIDKMWATLESCSSLRSIDIYHALLDRSVRSGNERPVMARLAQRLESFRLTTMMVYRLFAVRPRPASAPQRYLRFEKHISFYNPPHRLIFFKTGMAIDLAAVAAEDNPEGINNLMRDYQTNFIVHVCHELCRLPDAWARSQRPPEPVAMTKSTRKKRRSRGGDNDISSSDEEEFDSDSDGSGIDWLGANTEDNSPEAWLANDERDAVKFDPKVDRKALDRIPERLPASMRDGPQTETLVLRDGHVCEALILGLPITQALRTKRFCERRNAAWQIKQAGQLTMQEMVLHERMKERRRQRRAIAQFSGTSKHVILKERTVRNDLRETQRQAEEAQSRAVEAARTAKAAKMQQLLRQAERRRVIASTASDARRGKSDGVDQDKKVGEREEEEEDGDEQETGEDDKNNADKTQPWKVKGRYGGRKGRLQQSPRAQGKSRPEANQERGRDRGLLRHGRGPAKASRRLVEDSDYEY